MRESATMRDRGRRVRWLLLGVLGVPIVALVAACSSNQSAGSDGGTHLSAGGGPRSGGTALPSSGTTHPSGEATLPSVGTRNPSGGTTSPSAPSSSPGASAADQPVECARWGCQPRQTVNLPGNRGLRLWFSSNEQDYRSRPVLELTEGGVPVQWWISPQGDGWNGSLTCLATDLESNCVLVDSLGMHASVAEMVLVRGGRLVHPAHAEAISNSAGMRAADLDGDGYLDVIGTANDYQPNYAQGHNYWQTFRFANDQFTVTGCALQHKGEPAPTHLLTGACPTI